MKQHIATFLGIAALAVSLNVQAQDQPEPPAAPAPPAHPHGPPCAMLASLLDKFDKNQDGQLDATEMTALRAELNSAVVASEFKRPGGPKGGLGRGPRQVPPEILQTYDVDKDGTLNESERAALKQDVQDGKVTPPRGRGNGPKGPPKELVEKYDTDGDGVLSATEREALHQAEGFGPRHEMRGRGPHGPGLRAPATEEQAQEQ